MENVMDMEDIWPVFIEESRQNLDLVEDCLLKLADRPEDSDLVAALFRSLHTVKGCSRMMGLSSLETLVHRSEDLVSLVRDNGAPVDTAMVRLLLGVLDQLRLLLGEVQQTHQDVELVRVAQPIATLETAILARREPIMSAAQQEDDIIPMSALESFTMDIPEAGGASLEPEDAQPDEWIDPIQVQQIDLAEDPVSVRIFFDMALEEFIDIQKGLVAFVNQGKNEGLSQISESVDSLTYASQQMGFHSLKAELENLKISVLTLSSTQSPEQELIQDLLCKVVYVEDELTVLQQRYKVPSVLESTVEILHVKEDIVEGDHVNPGQERETTTVLQSIFDLIGEMAGNQTSLNQLIMRLSQADLLSDVFRILKNGQDSSRELEEYLSQRMEDVAELTRAENRVSASLGRLQEMSSELGLSLDRTIVDGMVVRIGRVDYLIPISAIQRIAGLSEANLLSSSAEGVQSLFRMEEEILPVLDLNQKRAEEDGAGKLVVVVEGESRVFALRIDDLIGQLRALVLPLEGRMAAINNACGCFLHSDGKVGLVLDPNRVAVGG